MDRINNKKNYIFIIIILVFFILSGCSSMKFSKKDSKELPEFSSKGEGFYHVVRKGETLLKISRKYNIPLQKIVEFNHLPDKNDITEKQLIFIPTKYPSFGEKNLDYDFIWPVKGKVISFFSKNKEKLEPFINIQIVPGSKIVAIKDGEVIFCSEGRFDKKIDKEVVFVKHFSGFTSIYTYDGKLLVKQGNRVSQGQDIFEYNDNLDRTSNILKFEIRGNHISKNPLLFLPQQQ